MQNEDAEGDRGGSARGKRPMLRRNSVSMILENPALAQTGAVDSLLMNYFPYGMAHAMHGVDGPEREGSMHSREGEGDTEGHHDHGDGAAGGGAGGEVRQPSVLLLLKINSIKLAYICINVFLYLLDICL